MDVLDAVMQHLDVCFVNTVMPQPNCRTTGQPSDFNSQVNYDTWYGYHKEDRPQFELCGKIAIRQNDLRRFYSREQPVGTW
eukprot:1328931-Pyramimonas_sp.AAC.1